MRLFELQRDQDETGVSGTGKVAQGVEFDDGICALRWLTATSSTAIYASAAELVTIHGHGGQTRMVYLPTPEIVVDGDEVTVTKKVTNPELASMLRDGFWVEINFHYSHIPATKERS